MTRQTATEWREKMEDKVDKIADAIMGANGSNVRLSVLETQQVQILDHLRRLNGTTKEAVGKADAADQKADTVDKLVRVNTKQLTIQWWLIGILFLGLAALAWDILKTSVL